MTPALVAALVRDFPTLFALALDPNERMAAFGTCECGDGWEPIIRRACEKLANNCPDLRFDCIKEKFGGLRLYTLGGAPEEAWDIIAAAEQESYTTCERCGKPGDMRDGGWIQTLCDAHARKKPDEDPGVVAVASAN